MLKEISKMKQEHEHLALSTQAKATETDGGLLD